jgi:nitric oxide reductase NorE protein
MTQTAPAQTRVESSPTASTAEDGVWLFVLGDLLIYGLLFVLYAHAAGTNTESFRAGQALLSRPIAFANTLVLLTGSWFVARALWSLRAGEFVRSERGVRGAIVCALAFIALKIIEYGTQIYQGWYLTSSDFLMYYFVLTSIHLLHVVAGVLVLMLMLRLVRARANSEHALRTFTGGAVFWHLVDLLWLMLFPLLYLIA